MAQRNISAPYGDIVLANTPALDRWGQQLYAEQKAREVRMQQENMALDANIQKELGKVRSVDTPEIIKSYQQYKNLSKELMFNNSLKKDPLAYNQVRQAAAAAYQNIFTTRNMSAEAKDLAKSMFEGRMKKPTDFHDNAGEMIGALMNTPLSQLRQHPQFGDLTNPDNYIDRGMNTNWGEMERQGIGDLREVYSEKAPMEGGLQTQITPFKFRNTPLQLKDYMVGAMGMRQAGKDAVKAWDNLPEEEIANTIKQYQALPNEYWQKMGLQGPQDLFPKNPDSKAENWASYRAMKYAIANEPKPDKPQIVNNIRAIKDLEFDRAKQMEAIKQGNREDLERMKKSLKGSDAEVSNLWYQKYLDNVIAEAKTGGPEGKGGERHHVYMNKSGKSLFYYNMVKPSSLLIEAFKRGKSYPDRIGVTESGDIVPIFFEYDDKGSIRKNKDGTNIVDQDLSQPMSYDQALTDLGYRGSTKKQLSKELPNAKPAPNQKKVSIDELKKKYNLNY